MLGGVTWLFLGFIMISLTNFLTTFCSVSATGSAHAWEARVYLRYLGWICWGADFLMIICLLGVSILMAPLFLNSSNLKRPLAEVLVSRMVLGQFLGFSNHDGLWDSWHFFWWASCLFFSFSFTNAWYLYYLAKNSPACLCSSLSLSRPSKRIWCFDFFSMWFYKVCLKALLHL